MNELMDVEIREANANPTGSTGQQTEQWPARVLERLDAEISTVEAELIATQQRLTKLRSAREVLAQFGFDKRPRRKPAGAGPASRRVTLQDRIREALSGGPGKRDQILDRLSKVGVVTTEAALTTTLYRMRKLGAVATNEGVWTLSPEPRAVRNAVGRPKRGKK